MSVVPTETDHAFAVHNENEPPCPDWSNATVDCRFYGGCEVDSGWVCVVGRADGCDWEKRESGTPDVMYACSTDQYNTCSGSVDSNGDCSSISTADTFCYAGTFVALVHVRASVCVCSCEPTRSIEKQAGVLYSWAKPRCVLSSPW